MRVVLKGVDAVNLLARRASPALLGKLAKILREGGLLALREVVKRTPVDLGDHRGGWRVGLNAVPPLQPTLRDPRGDATIRAGYQVMRHAQPLGVIVIANGERAIETLEHGLFSPANPGPSRDPRPHRHGRILVSGGYSTQAPAGMLRGTCAFMAVAFPRIIQTIAAQPDSRFGGRA